MRLTSLSLTAVLFAAVACDLKVETIVYGTDTATSNLAGEWSGQWQSVATGNSGTVMLRVQQFQGVPVVALQLDNPCLQPGDYSLLLHDGVVELAAGDVVVLRAAEQSDGVLVGSYDCAADHGTLTATWQRSLPTPLDLTGSWGGEVVLPGADPLPVRVELTESVRNGALALDGQLSVPDQDLQADLTGVVQFHDESFDFAMRTADGVVPEVLLSGLGVRQPLRIDLALLQLLGAQPPFDQVVLHLAPLP